MGGLCEVSKMQWIAGDIKCPYFRNIVRQRIICEAITDRVEFSPMPFKSRAEMNEYIRDFCACECWHGCPLAEMIEKKYE